MSLGDIIQYNGSLYELEHPNIEVGELYIWKSTGDVERCDSKNQNYLRMYVSGLFQLGEIEVIE